MSKIIPFVNNAKDMCPKQLTRESLNNLLMSKTQKEMLVNYREKGIENAKAGLAAVLFNGRYSLAQAREYLSSKPKVGEKPHTRRDAQCYVSAPIFALDIDPKGCDMSAEEQFRRVCDKIEGAFGVKPVDVLVMAYKSPTKPGWRLVVKRKKGISIEEEMQRWNTILPYPCDEKCKNLNRIFYLTTMEDVMYINMDLLFDDADYNPEDYPVSAAPLTPSAQSTYPQAITDDYEHSELPYTFETLEAIADILERKIGGGKARQGNRNNQVYEMALHLRYLTGNNLPLLVRLIPDYSLPQEEHLRTINSALGAKRIPYWPSILQEAIDAATSNKTYASETDTDTPPAMPQNLPPALKHMLSTIPTKMQPAAAISSFPAWRILLSNVSFKYIDNMDYEPAFINITVAQQAEGKTSTRMPAECILKSVKEQDDIYREAEQRWRDECSTIANSKDKPNAPNVKILIVEPNMTQAAFIKRAADAQEHSLFTYAEELEKLLKIEGWSEIFRCAFDGASYGAERVSSNAVSLRIKHLRWNISACTTPYTARKIFKSEMSNGTFTRISIPTIMSDENDFGDEMPVYGDFDEVYQRGLDTYIKKLKDASGSGILTFTEAREWAEAERKRQSTILSASDNKAMVPFMKRSLLIAFWRACLLYIMHDGWSQEIADFCSWSVDYDLWVKAYYFGDMIENSNRDKVDNPYTKRNLLNLLPNKFTREDARNMRRDIGRSTNARDVRNMLTQWTYRGFIRQEEGIYVKITQQETDTPA